ncbi:P-loop NTPase [Glutamicibacter sp. JC586]|uniref:AAA family ATPase n=1 Tax=Glutamicibacter sp. JC586 TaxID=2590552 RepID=UPI00135BEB8A|nr:P-loop NTPase [Glutamicibacter sp. JC586]
MSISVVVLGDQESIVRQIEGYQGELIVTRVCADMAEAVAACSDGAADVLLVADFQLVPPMEQVDDLLAHRTAIVCLIDSPTDLHPLPDVLQVPADIAISELEQRIVATVLSLKQPQSAQKKTNPHEAGREQRASGKIVSFWSAPGSPGRSTIALNYAVECSAAGKNVVLLDADTYAASISIQLGLMDESASVAQICRIIDSGSVDIARLNAACSLVQVADSTIRVATGIPRSSRWPEVRASALRRACAVFKGHYDLVVVDLAPHIAMDEQLSFDTQAPQRNAVTVEMLQCSDEIFMVVNSDSVGIPRAIRAIDELEESYADIHPKIVFNRVSVSSSGRSPKRRLIEAWDRFGPMHDVVGFMPNDSAVCSASVLAGSPLLEIAPKSSLRSEIRSLTGIKSTDLPKKRAIRRFRKNSRTSGAKTG